MTIAKRRNETPITEYPPDEIHDGSQDVVTAGTAIQLTTTDTPCRLINIFAKAGNTGNVFVGGSTVSSARGMVLEPARSSDWFPIDNVNKIYIDCEGGNTDGVQYCWVV
uniref:Uncharacterized protein n=1 Tax=viral metagenome TaxID=1070528 RepID=A0A6M3L777_9ZZZZ